MTGVIVKMKHLRAANLCARGGRRWCAEHGISWVDFLQNGIPADVLKATGDSLAARAVLEAEKEASQ